MAAKGKSGQRAGTAEGRPEKEAVILTAGGMIKNRNNSKVTQSLKKGVFRMSNEEKMLDLLTQMQTDISSLKSGQEEMRTDIAGIKDRLDRVEDRAQQTAVLLETEVDRKLNLLYEGHDAIMERLDKLAARSELELLRSDMDLMKMAMRSMSQEIAELKKAQ